MPHVLDRKLLPWNYPPNRGLEKLIEETGLYPITILKLNAMELQSFAKIGNMVARALAEGVKPEEISKKTGIRIERIMELQVMARKIVFR